MTTTAASTPMRTMFMGISWSVRRVDAWRPPFKSRIASIKVEAIMGRDLIRLIIPEAATAPAPM